MAKELSKVYEPKEVERSIYEMWEAGGYFHAEQDETKKPFTIVMPPPIVTGQLHMGLAMDATLQDTLIRFKRMRISCSVLSRACPRCSCPVMFGGGIIML